MKDLRLATLLVFRKGADKEEVTEAVAMLTHLLDPEYHVDPEDKTHRVPFRIEEYEGLHGGPVFYIP